MPFNPFKSSSKSSSFTPSSSTPQDTTFPSPDITCALAADILKRLDPNTFANISAADIQKYLDKYQRNEPFNHWSWISGSFPFRAIHDALTSFSTHSLDRHTKKSLQAFVKQDQKTQSELVAHIYKTEKQEGGDWFVGKKRRDKEDDIEILKGYMHEREKGGPPLEEDD
ncbi:hypothetical protein XANCAGTX0491_003277 [Xanthoria calcicola]